MNKPLTLFILLKDGQSTINETIYSLEKQKNRNLVKENKLGNEYSASINFLKKELPTFKPTSINQALTELVPYYKSVFNIK